MNKILILFLLFGFNTEAQGYDEFLKQPQKIKVTYPVYQIGYNTLGASNLFFVRNRYNVYIYSEVVMLHNKLSEISFLKSKLKWFTFLDPYIGLGSVLSSQESSVFLTIHSKQFISPKNGVGVKIFLNQDLVALGEDVKTKGIVSVYYFNNVTNFFKKHDILSIYFGWFSKEIDIDLNELDSVLSKAKELVGGKDNIRLGINYQSDVTLKYSYNIELDYNSFSLGFLFDLL